MISVSGVLFFKADALLVNKLRYYLKTVLRVVIDRNDLADSTFALHVSKNMNQDVDSHDDLTDDRLKRQ